MKRLSDGPLRLASGHVSSTPFGEYVDQRRRYGVQELESSSSPGAHPQNTAPDRAARVNKTGALSEDAARGLGESAGATRHGGGEKEAKTVEPSRSHGGGVSGDAREAEHTPHKTIAGLPSISLTHSVLVVDQQTPKKQLLLIIDTLQKELQERTLSVNAIQRNFEKLSARYAEEYNTLHDLQVRLRSAEEERSSVQKMLAVLRAELDAATRAEDGQRQVSNALRAEGEMWVAERGALVTLTQACNQVLCNIAHVAQETLESKTSLFASNALCCLRRLCDAAQRRDAHLARREHDMTLTMCDLLNELRTLVDGGDVTPRATAGVQEEEQRLAADTYQMASKERVRDDGLVDEVDLRRRQEHVARAITALQVELRVATECARSRTCAHNGARVQDLVQTELLAHRALVDAEADTRAAYAQLHTHVVVSLEHCLRQTQAEQAALEAKVQAEMRLTRERAERACVDAEERCAACVEALQEQLKLSRAASTRAEEELAMLRARVAEHEAHLSTVIARETASRCGAEAQLQALEAHHTQREARANAAWRHQIEVMCSNMEAAQRGALAVTEEKERTALVLRLEQEKCAGLTLEMMQLRTRLADDAARRMHDAACVRLLLEEADTRRGMEWEEYCAAWGFGTRWADLQARRQHDVGQQQAESRAEARFAVQHRESEERRAMYEEVLIHGLPAIYTDAVHNVVSVTAAKVSVLQREIATLRRVLGRLRVAAAETAPLWALHSADALKTDYMTAALAAWRQKIEVHTYEKAAATSLQRLIVVESSSESLYSCPLCLQLYSDPVTCVPCGHTYCERCLHDHAHNRHLRETVSAMSVLQFACKTPGLPVTHSPMLYCPECQMQNVREVIRSKTLEHLAEKYTYKRQVLQDMLRVTCGRETTSQA